jgi:hypothetical protein
MGVDSNEREGIEGDGIEGRIQGMELVISPLQNEAMVLCMKLIHKKRQWLLV